MMSLVRRPIVAVSLLWSSMAMADELVDAEITAVGRTVVAHPSSNLATTFNPAALSLTERYDVNGAFRVGPTGDLRWMAGIADASTNPYVSFGFVYEGGLTRPALLDEEYPGWWPDGEVIPNGRRNHDLTFALASPFLDRRLSVGLNGTLTILDTDRIGTGTTGNMDLGLAARPIDQLTLGFAARDILPIAQQYSRPTTFALGVRGGIPDVIHGSLEVDIRTEQVQQGPVDVGVGVDGRVKFIELRAGYRYLGNTADHALALGLGLGNDAGHLAYAVTVPLEDTTFAGTTHTISIVIKTAGIDRMEQDVLRGRSR